jgi:hypothetical protein
MRKLLLLIILLSWPALAQRFLPGGSLSPTAMAFSSFPVCNVVYQGALLWDTTNNCMEECNGTLWSCISSTSSASLNFFVDPSLGNDTNACTGSGANACLTIQGAYNKKPKTVKYPVTVSLACGTYAQGAFIEGDSFVYDTTNGGGFAPSAASTPSLTITGTEQNDTIATGSVTGTLASATQGGTSNTSVYGTATVTAAGWTTNDLTGRFFQITSGTDVGDIKPIVSNTATVVTVQGNWVATPDGTSHFAIVKPCSIVQDGLVDELQGTIGSIASGSGAAMIVRESIAAPTFVPQVIIQNVNIQVLLAGSNGIKVQGPGSNVAVQGVLFSNAGGVSNTTNSKGFFVSQNGSAIRSVNSVYKPSVNEYGVVTNSVTGTIPATINTPTWNGWAGVDLHYNLFLYAAITTSASANLVSARVGTWQNTFLSGSTLFAVNLQSGSMQSTGDTYTVSSGGGAAISSNFTTGSSGPTSMFLNSMTLTGAGGVTYGLGFQFNDSQATVCWNDTNSIVTGFGIAYNFGGTNATMACFTPATSGSTTADFQLGGQNDTIIQFSVAQRNAATPGYVYSHSSNNLVQ